MPQWPQPGLLPRDPNRGDRFEIAAFFGYEHNLASELRNPLWTAQLRDLGLSWHSVPRHEWHDYRHVDVVIAVRKSGTATSRTNRHQALQLLARRRPRRPGRGVRIPGESA
jgi:hypothetical protein